jgi:phosphoadenosine phosphosulfate reductase
MTPEEVKLLNEQFEHQDAVEILRWAWDRFGTRAAIGTSFQGAGLVIMHLAKQAKLDFPVFTLDTGLLFPETLALKTKLEAFFERPIESLEPDLSVEQQAAAEGPELWLRDPDLCCTIRKVMPLQSKLGELDCWITGLRRDQSDVRAGVQTLEVFSFGAAGEREIIKLSPLAGWPRERVWEHIRRERIPYHPLHDRGYRSIGCWPCTRPTGTGQAERAGRWTGFQKTECGIHTFLAKKN